MPWQELKPETDDLRNKIDLALQLHAKEFDVLIEIRDKIDKCLDTERQFAVVAKRLDRLEEDTKKAG